MGLLDEGTLFRTFQLTRGADWRSRGYDPVALDGGLFADARAERVVFLGAGPAGTDVAGTIETDEADRQVWAFYRPQPDGTTQRIVWTLTR